MQTEREEDETFVYFNLGDGGSVTLRGIEFDGELDGEPNATYLITFTMGEEPTPILVNKIDIQNCYIHNLMKSVLVSGNSNMIYNVVVYSTIIDNVIIDNAGAVVYYKYGGANYISLTNSTFYNIYEYGFRISGPVESGLPDNTPTVIIDHTTWYNIGLNEDVGSQREMIQGEKGPLLNPWTVSNSIFVNQANKDRTFINIKDTPGDSNAVISSICFWDIGNVNFREHSVSDTLRMYPEFADTTNGDFTLPAHSPLFSLGTNGGPIGDPRWYIGVYGIKDEKNTNAKSFALHQNYPNPFNPSTKISFNLEQAGFTTLSVYDLTGREVARLVSDDLGVGEYNYTFNSGNLSSGIYFYRLSFTGQTLTKKMMLIE